MKPRLSFIRSNLICIALYIFILIVIIPTLSFSLSIKTESGVAVGSYAGSYALLIGVSDYTNGWPDLESIPGDIDIVQGVLLEQGFNVHILTNPNANQLEDTLESFIDKYGYNKENRLIVYFAGHGHTMDEGERGYIVPSDAPLPQKNSADFKRNALDMNQIISWCRQIDAKHVLFLFDSCFSGTIFKQRSLPQHPPRINMLTSKPVRQFITAGSAGESVPAKSTFTPAFVDAIRFGLADLDKDGYITGTELGIHLQTIIPTHVQQTPQYGKISDYELSRGDFVFKMGTVVQPEIAKTMAVDQPVRGNTETKKRSNNDIKVSDTPVLTRKKDAEIVALKPLPARLPKRPNILIYVNGDENILSLYKAEVENMLLEYDLDYYSVENIPELRKKVDAGGLSIKWYEINQYTPDVQMQILIVATIKNAGTMMLNYHGRQTQLTHANFLLRAVDLTSGKIIRPVEKGRFKYTDLNMDKNLEQSVSPRARNLGRKVADYWKNKTANQ